MKVSFFRLSYDYGLYNMLSLQIEFLREYQLDMRHWVFLLTLFILTFTHTNKHRAHVLKHMQPFILFLLGLLRHV